MNIGCGVFLERLREFLYVPRKHPLNGPLKVVAPLRSERRNLATNQERKLLRRRDFAPSVRTRDDRLYLYPL